MEVEEWQGLVKDNESYKEMVLTEVYFHLCLHYFGDNFDGWNAL